MKNLIKINNGEVIVFPTDTVYGLGSLIGDLEGYNKIFMIKQRPKEKKVAVLFVNIKSIQKYAHIDKLAKSMIKHFLPGPLTIILLAKKPYIDLYHEDTIGIRIPNCHVAKKVLKINGPLKTTSINYSGQNPLNDIATIKNMFGDYIDCFVWAKVDQTLLSSTVIDMTNGLSILREGPISSDTIVDYYHKISKRVRK